MKPVPVRKYSRILRKACQSTVKLCVLSDSLVALMVDGTAGSIKLIFVLALTEEVSLCR